MFNADLALSVTMTALSTLLSTVMLPANLVLYTKFTYSAEVVKSLDWSALFVSLTVVIGGICSGLIASYWAKTTGNEGKMHTRANRMGNIAGLALILLSVSVSSSNQQAAIWDQDASFYMACVAPPIIGLTLAVSLASYFDLDNPERVSVSIESCYQNTGIATTVALTMFKTEAALATAIGVPLLYGIVEAVVILVFCLICWKSGWTKAPANANICSVLATSYEVQNRVEHEQESCAIEVVLSPHSIGEEKSHDMIFSQAAAGAYLIDDNTFSKIERGKCEKTTLTIDRVVMEDPTECSESDRLDDFDFTESDGIMVIQQSTQVGRRRFYDVLGQLGSPPLKASNVVIGVKKVNETMEPCVEESVRCSQRQRAGFDRKRFAAIRNRASGYFSQEIPPQLGSDDEDGGPVLPVSVLNKSCVENDEYIDCKAAHADLRAGTVVSRLAASSKSAVTNVAASVAKRPVQQKYATVSTASSPQKNEDEKELGTSSELLTEVDLGNGSLSI